MQLQYREEAVMVELWQEKKAYEPSWGRLWGKVAVLNFDFKCTVSW